MLYTHAGISPVNIEENKPMKTETAPVTGLNTNPFVTVPHLFVVGTGTFFPTAEIARQQAYSPNGVGMWTETTEHEGQTYFRSGYTNCWD